MFEIGRNDKCWCGSGKKYKACHNRSDEANLSPYIKKGYPIPDRSLILSPEQIEGVRKSAKVTVGIMNELEKIVKEGISTLEIDEYYGKLTKEAGGICACLNYEGYPRNCCISVNDVVCHGIPSADQILKDGDIVNIDITTIFDGYYADMSRMYMIGNVSDKARQLVEVTKECMYKGIETIKPYTPVAEIGNTINDITDKYGYGVVRALCGHGVGLDFHTDPMVNHFRTKGKSLVLVPGMVITVEPMINEGNYDVSVSNKDGWTVTTKDGSLSAQWEHTVLVTETGYEILTQ